MRATPVIWMCVAVLVVSAFRAQGNEPSWDRWHNTLAPQGKPANELTLARDGRSDYVIVLPAEPTTQEQKAAEELSTWLEQMSGAEFAVISDSEPARDLEISVGRTSRLAVTELEQAAVDLGDEGYAIAVKERKLFLFGGRHRGPLYAVFALLEEDLGCRWYYQSTSTIPQMAVLTCSPVPRHFVPRLKIRDPWYRVAYHSNWSLCNRASSPVAGLPAKWGGPERTPMFTHGFNAIIGRHIKDRVLKEHPEYFSLINGQRSTRQLCLTNSDVLALTIERSLAVLQEHLGVDWISISAYDGGGHCECEGCGAVDSANSSPAGSLIQFVNQVAEAVEKKYPDVLVTTLAYLDTLDAPTQVRPRHNVGIHLCNDLHSWRWPLSSFVTSRRPKSRQYRQAIIEWTRISDNVYIWDYFTNFSHYPGPIPNMHVLAESVDYYLEHGVDGIMFQASYQSPGGSRAPMKAWVMAKLFWDPTRDVAELQRDFVYGYFGEAAPAINDYYTLLDQAGVKYQDAVIEEDGGMRFSMDAPFLTKQLIAEADSHLRRAEHLAHDAQTKRRVAAEKAPILYVKLERGPGFTDEDYGLLIDEFAEITALESITHTREGGPDLAQKLEHWRKKIK